MKWGHAAIDAGLHILNSNQHTGTKELKEEMVQIKQRNVLKMKSCKNLLEMQFYDAHL